MGRYWALGLLSIVLRVLGVLTLLGYFVFWVNQIVISANPDTARNAYSIPQFQAPTPTQPDNTPPELESLYRDLATFEAQSYQWVYFLAIVILISVVLGWPLLALILYAIGQWIVLHLDMVRYAAVRGTSRASAPQRPKPEVDQFWDEQIARQKQR